MNERAGSRVDADPDDGRSDLERQLGTWAREAAAAAMASYGATGPLRFKHGQEAITEADARIERMLRDRIAQAYPGDRVSGEELGAADPRAAARGRLWHLDPIDGTLNFALGLPGFCVSMALYRDGAPLAACVIQPPTADLFIAVAGRGARRNGAAMTVSRRDRLDEAVVSAQLKKQGRIVQDPALLQALTLRCMKTRRVGAIALELAWVACGGCDALVASFKTPIQPYDVAAGLLLVAEAGGRITDLQGAPYRLGGSELLASNGRVHLELVDLLRGG